jgi:hypothetical protein
MCAMGKLLTYPDQTISNPKSLNPQKGALWEPVTKNKN